MDHFFLVDKNAHFSLFGSASMPEMMFRIIQNCWSTAILLTLNFLAKFIGIGLGNHFSSSTVAIKAMAGFKRPGDDVTIVA